MTGWYDFPDVKSSKMLSFYSVAEALGLIYPRPSVLLLLILSIEVIEVRHLSKPFHSNDRGPKLPKLDLHSGPTFMKLGFYF